MAREKIKILFIGILGGVLGVILMIGIAFGFFFIMSKLHTIKITCLPQEEVQRKNISCEILEIKDRGNILKTSEMISPPVNEEEFKRITDITTNGKFVEIKLRIKNNRKETLNLSEIFFIDKNERNFPCPYGNLRYWLPDQGNISFNLLPGTEEEITKIFEVSKDSELSKLETKLFKTSRILD